MDRYEKRRGEYEIMLSRPLQAAGCEVQKDAILPDTYGDMKKILATSYKLSPRGDSAESDGITYTGLLSVTVVFLTEEGSLGSLTVESDYEGRVPMALGEATVNVASFPTAEGVQSRLVNPRKLGIRARIKPNLFVWEDRDTALIFPDSVTDEDRMTFEENYRRVSYLYAESFRAEGIESGDDILLDSTREAISECVMHDIRFSSLSAEARNGAVAVNASAEITVFYVSESGAFTSLTHTMPISTLVECEGVRERDTAVAALYWEGGSLMPEENADGEKRLLECDFTYAVSLLVTREEEAYLAADVYSTRYDTELSQSDLILSRYPMKASASARASSTLSVKEGLVPIGSHPILKQYRIESSEEGRALLTGSAQVSVILRDAESEKLVDKTVDLSFSVSLGMPYENSREYLALPVLGYADVKAVGGELSVSLPISLSLLSWQRAEERAVTAVTPTAVWGEKEASAFTVYYPRENESAWEIAKKYRVREDDLIFADSDEFRTGISRRCVMIPPARRACFKGVVTP